MDRARETVAAAFGAHPDEIYFTSGGTESDNWVIRSVGRFGGKRKRIVTSAVEHHAILRTVEAMRGSGYETVVLGVDESCRVSPESLRKAVNRGDSARQRDGGEQ